MIESETFDNISVESPYRDQTKEWYDYSEDKKKCHQCGEWFKRIGHHWSGKSCNHPQLSTPQREIVVGLLMGDGYVQDNGGVGNPLFKVYSTNLSFLFYLRERLGYICTVIDINRTADQSHDKFGHETDNPLYHDCYELRTHSLPDYKELRSWYSGGEKHYPDDLELSPLKMMLWYCCDGSIERIGNHSSMEMGKTVGTDSEDKIRGLFEEQGWEYYRTDNGFQFDVGSTELIQEYMTELPECFKYKSINGPPKDDVIDKYTTINYK